MTQREIKFRAWNLTDKQWDIPTTEYSITSGPNALFDRKKERVWFNRGDIILMQYTGLKDKNGKEIYEGDIVVVRELHDGDDYAWNQPTGPAIPCKITWDDDYKRFDFGGCKRIIYSPSHFEVIGNIYENPELLK